MPSVTINLTMPQAQRVVDALVEDRRVNPNDILVNPTVKEFMKTQLIKLVRNHERGVQEREARASVPDMDLDGA